MSLESIKKEIQELLPSDWELLYGWVVSEEPHRRRKEQQKAEVIVELQDDGVLTAPESSTKEEVDKTTNNNSIPEWKNPGTDHTKMYRQGVVVKHNNKLWINNFPYLNSWEPGTTNSDAWSEYFKPSKSSSKEDGSKENPFNWRTGVNYKIGQYVKYNNKIFKLVQNHTSVDHYRPGPGLESIYQEVK